MPARWELLAEAAHSIQLDNIGFFFKSFLILILTYNDKLIGVTYNAIMKYAIIKKTKLHSAPSQIIFKFTSNTQSYLDNIKPRYTRIYRSLHFSRPRILTHIYVSSHSRTYTRALSRAFTPFTRVSTRIIYVTRVRPFHWLMRGDFLFLSPPFRSALSSRQREFENKRMPLTFA